MMELKIQDTFCCYAIPSRKVEEISSLMSIIYIYVRRKSEGLNGNILQILLYGDKYLPLEANKLILNLTIKYLLETKRFG